MITYKDNKGNISTYTRNYKSTLIDLSSRRIVEIIKIEELDEMTNITTFDLSNNLLTEIKGLESMVNLSTLYLSHNQITEIKGLDSSVNLTGLDLSSNQITEIKGLDGLVNLTTLGMYCNQINEIKGLDNLVNLFRLDLSYNQITEIKGLDSLVNLSRLDLSYNRITEIKGLDSLVNLSTLNLIFNQITEIKGLDSLVNLTILCLESNQITEIPLTIMNLRRLRILRINLKINPIIERFLNKNKIKEGKTIYDDSQNVHDSHIVKSIQKSVYALMSDIDHRLPSINCNCNSKELLLDYIIKEIIDDKILDSLTKKQLIEYCHDKTVHSVLNLTFDEVLCCVWIRIAEHKACDEIKKILNVEMKDSMCKCFTGRLSRLVNCLNGFDERVSIIISDKQEILNVIIKVRKIYDEVEKQKEMVMKELLERRYGEDVINEYLIYLE